MNPIHLSIMLPLIIVFALPIIAAFTTWRHQLWSLPALAVTLLSTLGAWYAYAESVSLTWTVGYGVFAVLGVLSTGRHLTASAKESALPHPVAS